MASIEDLEKEIERLSGELRRINDWATDRYHYDRVVEKRKEDDLFWGSELMERLDVRGPFDAGLWSAEAILRIDVGSMLGTEVEVLNLGRLRPLPWKKMPSGVVILNKSDQGHLPIKVDVSLEGTEKK